MDLDAYGRTKVVELINVGETVLSADNKVYPIERIGTRQVAEDIVRIKSAGISGKDLLITKDHPVLMWRPKSTLKPSRLNFNKADAEKQYIKAGEVREGDWVYRPRPIFEATTKDFPYSPFIVGMYIAEGCLIKRHLVDGVSARGVQFTLGSHEHVLIERLNTELIEYSGAVPTVDHPESRPDIVQIRIFDPELADWLDTNIGQLVEGKSLCADIFHLPVLDRLKLISAWIDGDGYAGTPGSKVTSMHIYSASFPLLYQALILAQSCGLNPSIARYTRVNTSAKGFTDQMHESRLVFHTKDMVALHPHVHKANMRDITEGPGRGNCVYATETGIWRQIVKISTEPYVGAVHSLRVESSHNYLVNGIVTHNCEYIYLCMGTYRSASRRVVRYFLTEIDITGESEDERDNIQELLER